MTRGAEGAKAGAPPLFTAREVSRDRGNFLLSRAILASKIAARNDVPSVLNARAVPRRSASGTMRRNKKIGAYFPHDRRIVSSISDASVRHERFLANDLNNSGLIKTASRTRDGSKL